LAVIAVMQTRTGEIMNKKVMVAAVAAALAAPAAFAQTTVTIGGTINIMWDTVRANNATRNAAAANFDMHSHDRVRDGAGSNIRFFVGEELGGGNQAFIQVESAVIGNSDTRANNAGTTAAGVNSWGNRNSAIGLRSKTAGRFLIGVWDMHYDEMYGIESGWLIANSGSSALSMWQNFGSAFTVNPGTGGRLANTIRWDSPQWGGFSMSAQYARPSDAAPANAQFSGIGGGSSVINDKKNRAWHLAARYQTGGLQVRYAYLQDKNSANTATMSFGGATAAGAFASTMAMKVTSHRLGARYRFAMGFGFGMVWDQSKWSTTTDVAATDTGIKRTSWAIPLTYDTGNHSFYGTYGRARDWKGSFNGCSVNDTTTAGCANVVINAALPAGSAYSLANDTSSRFVSLGYAYKLSQRTNVHVSYQKITNDALARYDFFANTSGTAAAQVGADPRSFAIGMRHTF
jgi:predicted porin